MTQPLTSSVEGTVSRHTNRDYRAKVENHIIPAIGRKNLKNLTSLDLQRLYCQKADGGYTRTVRYIHTTMLKALYQAEAGTRYGRMSRGLRRSPRPPDPKRNASP